MINLIVAVTKNGVIGSSNQMPWYYKEDLKHFKKITLGNVVIMGRKTFESMGKPLKERENIVITSSDINQLEHLHKVSSIDEALELAMKFKDKKIFIIGGASVYEEVLKRKLPDTIYLTLIDKFIEGDKKFNLDYLEEFDLISEKKGETSELSFRIYFRRK